MWHNWVRTPQLPAPVWKNIHIETSYTDLEGSRRVPLTLSTVSRDNLTAAQMQFRLVSFALIVLNCVDYSHCQTQQSHRWRRNKRGEGTVHVGLIDAFTNSLIISHLADASTRRDLRSPHDRDCPIWCKATSPHKNYHGNRGHAFIIFLWFDFIFWWQQWQVSIVKNN